MEEGGNIEHPKIESSRSKIDLKNIHRVDDFHQWLHDVDLGKHEDDSGWKVSKNRADKSLKRYKKNC